MSEPAKYELVHTNDSSAVISPCGRYRYWLRRRWSADMPVLWIMLNPSKADATADDPTIRKCIGFSKRWGAGGIEVVNLFAWRATDPRELADAIDPVGPENDAVLARVARSGGYLHRVVAWGGAVEKAGRTRGAMRVGRVLELLRDTTFRCLGETGGGHPLHPLMQPYRLKPRPWRPE